MQETAVGRRGRGSPHSAQLGSAHTPAPGNVGEEGKPPTAPGSTPKGPPRPPGDSTREHRRPLGSGKKGRVSPGKG